jgi:hypothetical protein
VVNVATRSQSDKYLEMEGVQTSVSYFYNKEPKQLCYAQFAIISLFLYASHTLNTNDKLYRRIEVSIYLSSWPVITKPRAINFVLFMSFVVYFFILAQLGRIKHIVLLLTFNYHS